MDDRILVANPLYPYDDLSDRAEVVTGNPPTEPANTEEELVDLVAGVDAVLVTSRETITRPVFEAADDLDVLVKYGARPGPEKVDIEAATDHGVPVAYTPGSNADSVAEFSLLLALAVLRDLPLAARTVEAGGWRTEELGGRELAGKTLGVIGYGLVGRALVETCAGFDLDVVLYDPFVPDEDLAEAGRAVDDLDDLLAASDVVSIHCALTEDTRGLLGEREFEVMKPGAVLVNTARGPIVDEAALARALDDGELRGAGIDVFEEEPPGTDHPLVGREDVIATPHVAGVTREASTREREMAHEEVLRVLDGEEPRWAINEPYS